MSAISPSFYETRANNNYQTKFIFPYISSFSKLPSELKVILFESVKNNENEILGFMAD